MSWVDLLHEAEDELEESYDKIEAAVEESGSPTSEAEKHIENEIDKISRDLDSYESQLEDVYGMIIDLEHENESEVLTAVEEADQHLENAYTEVKELYNTAATMIQGGVKVVRGPEPDRETISQEKIDIAIDKGEQAFNTYDKLLQNTAVRVEEEYSVPEGWSDDIGLELSD